MKEPAKTFRSYYYLTKPGIIYGNLATTTAGFLLASQWHIDFALLIATLVGIALIIACACVINNYIDRDIDKLMDRTKQRAIATGVISKKSAFTYAAILGSLGFLTLAVFTNWLTVLLGVIALLVYDVLYGIAKRRSVWGTLVGSVAGALPPVAGYTAVTNNFDTGALLLFIIMACWQMPHFYAIALYRLEDYKNAGLPVWPVKRGEHQTKVQIALYILAFTVATMLLTLFGYTGLVYLVVMGGIGLYWFHLAFKGLDITRNKNWAKRMFLFSLVVNLVFCVMTAFGGILP